MKRIVCMGGGPAGLYSAILLKKRLPRARIEVHERNRPDDTFGWGVVFSDKTMASFADADPESHAAIVGNFYHWDDIDVHIHGQMIRSGGHGFSGIERKRLLNILQERAAALGVEQTFQHEVRDEADFADADLLIAPTASTVARASSMPRRSSRASMCASAVSSGSARRRNFRRSRSRSNAPSTAGSRSTPISSARSFRR